MKKLKKYFIILVVLMFINNTIPANADDTIKVPNIQYNKIYQEYEKDIQFNLMIKEYGEEYGRRFLNNVIKREVASEVRDGGGNLCYQYVKNIMQTKYNNCGTTTVLQTLYGLNSANAVEGVSDYEKITTLDKKYNVSGQGSLYVYQVVNALAKYSTLGNDYIYREGKALSLIQFENSIAQSLTSGKPVVLHARTEYLGYYGGKKLGHYLSLDSIDRNSHVVRIVDCNYDPSFYGQHYVTSTEAYETINKEAGRYLIY